MAKVRVAVIGRTSHGDYGHDMDTVWLDVPNAEVVAVADDNATGLAAAAKRLKVDKAFTDYREMLDKVKPQVVSIATRWTDKHHEIAMAALERGIHVYLEKPFCRTLEEADAIVAACERAHVRLAIAHQTRYSPKFQIVKQLVAEGKIGRLLELRGRGKEDSRGGSEDLWVLGSHIMDLMRALAGPAQWCFARITQDGHPITKADVHDGPEGLGPLAGNVVSAMYGFDRAVTGYFGSQRGAAGKGSRFGLQIFGTAGVIEILTGYLPSVKFLADPAWSPGRSGAAWQNVSSAGIGQPEPLKDGGLHAGNLLGAKDLLAAIAENREPISGVYEARGATEMILATFESQRQNRAVSLPLENRKHPLTMLS